MNAALAEAIQGLPPEDARECLVWVTGVFQGEAMVDAVGRTGPQRTPSEVFSDAVLLWGSVCYRGSFGAPLPAVLDPRQLSLKLNV